MAQSPVGDGGGVGCRTLLKAVAALVGFAVAAVAAGLALILGDDPSPTAETLGLTLYAAGAPVSGMFAAIAGDLPLTLYLDLLVWVLAGAGVTRMTERGRSLWVLVATVFGVALVYGFVISTLVELA